MKRLAKGISVILTVCSLMSVTAWGEALSGNSYTVDKKGEVYTDFSENGAWSDSEFTGYNNAKVRVTNEAGAMAVSKARPNQLGYKQEFYVWKSVLRDGDKNAVINVVTNTESITKKLDFSSGYAGWVRVGVVNLPDIFITSTLTASGNGLMPFSAIKYIQTDDTEYTADRIFDKNEDLMIMKKDSDKCLYNHEKLYFEDAVPTIVNNRMLVPLRFISENMGADVTWNKNDKSAEIKKDGKTIVFYIDSTRYTVNGEEKFFEQAPVIINSRTMIPLRALAESLDCSVDYHDGGLVLIGKTITYDDTQKDNYIEALKTVLDR